MIEGNLVFFCPACQIPHELTPSYFDFDGQWASPTISQDIVYVDNERCFPYHCHSLVRNGFIEFLSDCTHDLANTTVPMRPFGCH